MRVPEVREEQARIATENGLYGFCYYHYWFNGKRVLQRPFQEVFESGKPNFPFMLAWANENWTRAWDGSENCTLLSQEYCEDDHVAHIESLIPYFKDERYIKVGDRPVFAIYRDDHIPNIKGMLQTFRRVARENGLELYLCRFDRKVGTRNESPEELGFDAAIEFQPFSKSFREYSNQRKASIREFVRLLPKRVLKRLRKIPGFSKFPKGNIILDTTHDFSAFVDFDLKRTNVDYKCYPCVCPSWDNSARREEGSATIFTNSSPQLFYNWTAGKVRRFKPYSEEENFLFINAWNEWAEGNHLEPCSKYGYSYLGALRKGLMENQTLRSESD